MGSDKHAICGYIQAKGVNLDVINSSSGIWERFSYIFNEKFKIYN